MSSKINIGLDNGKLKECPDSPNCVCSFSDKESHFMEAADYQDIESTKSKLLEIIKKTPRTEIVKDQGNYIHYTYTSLLFRFIDDIEFYFDENTKKLHFRSASRVGHSDLGVNKKRIKKILQELNR